MEKEVDFLYHGAIDVTKHIVRRYIEYNKECADMNCSVEHFSMCTDCTKSDERDQKETDENGNLIEYEWRFETDGLVKGWIARPMK